MTAWTVVSPGLKEALMRYRSLISHFKGRRQSVYFAWKRSLMSNLLFFCRGQTELCCLQNRETAEVVYGYCSLPLATSLCCARIKSYELSPAACPYLRQLPPRWGAATTHSPAFPPMAAFLPLAVRRPCGMRGAAKSGSGAGPEERASCSFMNSWPLLTMRCAQKGQACT